MSSTTTYLTITRPVGTERRQLTIWNGNWNAIDAAFNPSTIGAAGAQVAVLRDTAQTPTYTTSATKMLNLTPTWNHNSAHTIIFANVTDTLSAAAALLADLQVGGTSQWKVTKGGATTQLGRATATHITLTTAASTIVPGATSLSLRNNADSADNLILTDAGAATFRSTVGGITTLTATTLAGTLSTAAQANVTSLGTLTSLGVGAITTSADMTFTGANRRIIPGTTDFAINNNANTANNLLITDAGAATIRAGLTVSAGVVTTNDATLVRGGATTPPAGAGVEILYATPIGYIRAYDRTGAAYKNLVVNDTLTIVGNNGTSTFGGGVTVSTGSLIVSAAQTPASAGAAGTAGTIAWDASYIYICTATNTWERVGIASW